MASLWPGSKLNRPHQPGTLTLVFVRAGMGARRRSAHRLARRGRSSHCQPIVRPAGLGAGKIGLRTGAQCMVCLYLRTRPVTAMQLWFSLDPHTSVHLERDWIMNSKKNQRAPCLPRCRHLPRTSLSSHLIASTESGVALTVIRFPSSMRSMMSWILAEKMSRDPLQN